MSVIKQTLIKYEWQLFSVILLGVGIPFSFVQNNLDKTNLAIFIIALPGLLAFSLQFILNRNLDFVSRRFPELKYLAIALSPFIMIGFIHAIKNGISGSAEIGEREIIAIQHITILFIAVLIAEFGWRAYLQNLIVKRFGFLQGVLIVGLFLGLWNNLIRSIFSEPNPINSYLYIMTCVQMIALSILGGYIYKRSQSLIAPIILHFTWILMQYFSTKLAWQKIEIFKLTLLETAIWIIVAEVTIWRLLKHKKNKHTKS